MRIDTRSETLCNRLRNSSIFNLFFFLNVLRIDRKLLAARGEEVITQIEDWILHKHRERNTKYNAHNEIDIEIGLRIGLVAKPA